MTDESNAPNKPIAQQGIEDIGYRQRFGALEQDYQSLLNKVAELSMKLNKMESSLREFEKQKVDPLKEVLSSHDCRINNIFERINKLEETFKITYELMLGALPIDINKHFNNALSGRIEKLEKINSPEFIDNAQRNYEIVRNTQHKLEERIENLENAGVSTESWTKR